MIIAEMNAHELQSALRSEGLGITVGPFIFRIRSTINGVLHHISRAYADYSVASDGVFDYQVGVSTNALRRIDFWVDGHKPFHSFPRRLAVPLLEWGMNWCVYRHSHQFLALHAAVVEKDGLALLLPGRSGSGKSTICSQLVANGWRLLSDEMALLKLSDGAVVPVPRPISLKNASIDLASKQMPGLTLTGDYNRTGKGRVGLVKAPKSSIDLQHQTAEPAMIVFPRFAEDVALRMEHLPQSRALLRIAENAFNYRLLGSAGFETLCRVVGRSDCFDLEFPPSSAAVVEITRTHQLAVARQQMLRQERGDSSRSGVDH